MADTKLLPCPFCGSAPESRRRSGEGGYWEIVCTDDDCPGQVRVAHDFQDAATAAWNTRTPDPRLAAAQGLADAIKAVQLQLLQSNNQTEYAQEANDMARAAITAWEKAVR